MPEVQEREREIMKYKEALRAAGIKNPGRTTWCKVATDGIPVFTIWSDDVRVISGRRFAWWDHRDCKLASVSVSKIAKRRGFIKLAAAHLGQPCRAVIVHRKGEEVLSADYPHPKMATVRFLTTNIDAAQFLAELT